MSQISCKQTGFSRVPFRQSWFGPITVACAESWLVSVLLSVHWRHLAVTLTSYNPDSTVTETGKSIPVRKGGLRAALLFRICDSDRQIVTPISTFYFWIDR